MSGVDVARRTGRQAWRQVKRHPVVAACGVGLLIQVLVYVCVYEWARMEPERRLPQAARVEAMQLLQLARDKKDPLPDRLRHAALGRKVRGPVFVKLHMGGHVLFSYRSKAPVTIAKALVGAAKAVREDSEVQALSTEERQKSRFKVDVAQGRAPIVTFPEILFAVSLVPGVDGLGVYAGGKTAYLDPDESLRLGLVTGYQPFKFVPQFKAGLHIQEANEFLARQLRWWETGKWKKVKKRYFRFRTAGFVEAPFLKGKRGAPLPVYRGNTPMPKFNRAAVVKSCVEGGNYILRQLTKERERVQIQFAYKQGHHTRLYERELPPDWSIRTVWRVVQPGQFKYIYHPLTDNYDVMGYSLPRHAGTTYAFALLYGNLKGRKGVTKQQVQRFRGGAERAIDYLSRMVEQGQCRDDKHNFVCVSRGAVTDLGSSALPLVAIMEYQRQTGDKRYESLGRRLANFLLYMQKDDGEFCHIYHVRKGRKSCKEKLLYYSGEAALGLALAYTVLRDPRYRKGTRKALDYLTGANYAPITLKFLFGEDHWTCMAAEAAWPAVKRRRYARFCYDFAAFQRRHQFRAGDVSFDFEGGYGITPFFPPHLTPAGSRTEAMVSTYYLSKHRGETKRVVAEQIVRAFKYIVRHQVRPENSYLLAKPAAALGAIRKSPIKHEIRIDYIQHTVAAMVRALDLVPE